MLGTPAKCQAAGTNPRWRAYGVNGNLADSKSDDLGSIPSGRIMKKYDMHQLPFGAWVAMGFAALGLGIAVSGMSSCESKRQEEYMKAQVETAPLKLRAIEKQQEELRWQLEQGIITKEEYASKMNDAPVTQLMKSWNKGEPTTAPTKAKLEFLVRLANGATKDKLSALAEVVHVEQVSKDLGVYKVTLETSKPQTEAEQVLKDSGLLQHVEFNATLQQESK